jgi:hypothetical protein
MTILDRFSPYNGLKNQLVVLSTEELRSAEIVIYPGPVWLAHTAGHICRGNDADSQR